MATHRTLGGDVHDPHRLAQVCAAAPEERERLIRATVEQVLALGATQVREESCDGVPSGTW